MLKKLIFLAGKAEIYSLNWAQCGFGPQDKYATTGKNE